VRRGAEPDGVGEAHAFALRATQRFAAHGPAPWPLGRFRLDIAGRRVIDAAGRAVPLRPKSFEVLRVLAERSGQAVARRTLLDLVWPDAEVTDDSLTQCVREIRLALGQDAGAHLRTLSRQGYLLEAHADTAGERAPAAVALLPFLGLGDHPAQLLAAGMAEDLAVELARRGGLELRLPRPATGKARPGIAAAALELHGSVRCGQSGTARITVLLLRPDTRGVHWGACFDGRLAKGLFLDQHEAVVSRVAEAVALATQPGPPAG
jgi:DNA-binding winged helix-turn-helix (wHTH) protein